MGHAERTMPSYSMKHKQTGEVVEMFLSLKERDELLEAGEYEQVLTTPSFISQHGSTINKTSDGWKDVLKKVKSGSGRQNTIRD